jgi:hypothetical protein
MVGRFEPTGDDDTNRAEASRGPFSVGTGRESPVLSHYPVGVLVTGRPRLFMSAATTHGPTPPPSDRAALAPPSGPTLSALAPLVRIRANGHASLLDAASLERSPLAAVSGSVKGGLQLPKWVRRGPDPRRPEGGASRTSKAAAQRTPRVTLDHVVWKQPRVMFESL